MGLQSHSILYGVLLALFPVVLWSAEMSNDSAVFIQVGGQGVREAIRKAPAHSVIVFDRNERLTLSAPIVIDKPLTLRGINAQLADGIARVSIILVTSTGFRLTDFELHGNASNLPSDDRAPLVTIRAGDFVVERGFFRNSAKDGVMIQAKDGDIIGGTVRDVVGVANVRDVVSIAGGKQWGRVRQVLVENVRAYGSILRGGVEVSDGMVNVTVRKVYAENCVYAIDVQDHGDPGQINRSVLVEDVHAVRCRHAIRTKNNAQGHLNLTIRDVVAEQCELPVQISNTNNVLLDGVRIMDHDSNHPPVLVTNCNGLTIRGLSVLNSAFAGAALLVVDCQNTLIDGLDLRGEIPHLTSGVTFTGTRGGVLSGLVIRNVMAPHVQTAGIYLSAGEKGGTLDDFIISGNVARVKNTFTGDRGIIEDNLE